MSVGLGDEAPDFTAETTEGPVKFHDWKGKSWAILFSHPKDFTPVCTTELGAVAALKPEFRQAQHEGHRPQRRSPDVAREVARRYQGRYRPDRELPDDRRPRSEGLELVRDDSPERSDTMTVRSVYIVGPDNKVKLTLTYPASTGGNFAELVRVLDSLQLTAGYSVATPADWKQGEDVIIVPAVSDEDAKTKFPKGFVAKKPYYG